MRLKVVKYKITKSTNDVAIKLIKKNLQQPTLIKANKQTKGRGTMGKNGFQKMEIYFYQFSLSSIQNC